MSKAREEAKEALSRITPRSVPDAILGDAVDALWRYSNEGREGTPSGYGGVYDFLRGLDPASIIPKFAQGRPGYPQWVDAERVMINKWLSMFQEGSAESYASYYKNGASGPALDDRGVPRDAGWLSPNGKGMGYVFDYGMKNEVRLAMIEALNLGSHESRRRMEAFPPPSHIGPGEPDRTLHLLISRWMLVMAGDLVAYVGSPRSSC